jgi:hypothetical protein
MRTEEGTDGETEQTDSHADGRTPFKRIVSFRDYARRQRATFNINNNNIYYLQMGRHPVAVVILHMHGL